MQRPGPRVTSACRNCKQRRRKCDGIRPKCFRCDELAIECTYDNVDRRKARHSHLEVDALQNRIAYLEEQVRSLQQNRPTAPRDTYIVEPAPSTDSTTHFPNEDASVAWESLDGSADWLLELPPLPWDTDKTSLVRSLLAKKGSELQFDKRSGKMVYVGPTSNHHLMGTISSMRSPSAAPSDATIAPAKPTFSVAEVHLFRIFQSKVHPAFPVVCGDHHPELAELIQQALSHNILCHIMLAIGAFLLDEADLVSWNISRETLLSFYAGAFTANVGPELENCSIQNVKLFLLKAYYDALRGSLESATVFNSEPPYTHSVGIQD
ncbi:transcriptional regulator family: Fungal Specific TF [Paecilomyces variotii]|nr:transcriptional regulator family: Fungal Specific TF [Paecilomyces variotii]KAJ9228755.1 transcriptional regulator family: Fungal Specific TF [Paecilomyces variotii]